MDVGDKVTICFTKDMMFPFNNGFFIENCLILQKPQDVGDCYEFMDSMGNKFTLNPNCSDFVGLYKETTD